MSKLVPIDGAFFVLFIFKLCCALLYLPSKEAWLFFIFLASFFFFNAYLNLTPGLGGRGYQRDIRIIYLAKTYIVFTVHQAMMLNVFQNLDVLLLESITLYVSIFRYRL